MNLSNWNRIWRERSLGNLESEGHVDGASNSFEILFFEREVHAGWEWIAQNSDAQTGEVSGNATRGKSPARDEDAKNYRRRLALTRDAGKTVKLGTCGVTRGDWGG